LTLDKFIKKEGNKERKNFKRKRKKVGFCP